MAGETELVVKRRFPLWVYTFASAIPLLLLLIAFATARGEQWGATLFVLALSAGIAWLGFKDLLKPDLLRLTAQGITFGRKPAFQEAGWDQLVGLVVEDRVRVQADGGYDLVASRATMLLADGRRWAFDLKWPGGEDVAASLFAGRFDPDAPDIPDDECAVIAADDGRVLEAPPRPQPALALRVPRVRLERWLDAADAVLATRGAPKVDRRMLTVDLGEIGHVALFAFARWSIRADETAWPDAIRTHLDELAVALTEEIPDNFEQARPLLRVQLYPRGGLGGAETKVPGEPFGPDLTAVVVVERPSSRSVVTQDQAGRWNRSASELFAIGRANLAAEPLPTAIPPPDIPLHIFTGAALTSSRVFDLARLIPDLRPDLGAFVGLPALDTLIVLPIASGAEMLHLLDGRMANGTREIHAEARWPLSPHLYWYVPGSEPVPVPQVPTPNGGVNYHPPRDLLQRMLAGGKPPPAGPA